MSRHEINPYAAPRAHDNPVWVPGPGIPDARVAEVRLQRETTLRALGIAKQHLAAVQALGLMYWIYAGYEAAGYVFPVFSALAVCGLYATFHFTLGYFLARLSNVARVTQNVYGWILCSSYLGVLAIPNLIVVFFGMLLAALHAIELFACTAQPMPFITRPEYAHWANANPSPERDRLVRAKVWRWYVILLAVEIAGALAAFGLS